MGQFTNENTEVTEINNCFLVWKCIENYSSEPVNSEREPKVSVTQSGKNSAEILGFISQTTQNMRISQKSLR